MNSLFNVGQNGVLVSMMNEEMLNFMASVTLCLVVFLYYHCPKYLLTNFCFTGHMLILLDC